MAEQNTRAICIGEVMVELSRGHDARYELAFGGDTFNTAVYLARSGIDTAYATALGDDRYSEAMLAFAATETVNTDFVVRVPGRLPGLYVIETDANGERTFSYWRDASPARELFDLGNCDRLAEALTSARLVYFSGVTLSLYSGTGLNRFFAMLERARQRNVSVAFDGNFRMRGWKGDMARARAVFTEALKHADIALPTFEDEAVLWGDVNPDATVIRLQTFGIGEVVVKNGRDGALVANGKARALVPVAEVLTPIDTTAAGDSFNAAYLAARLKGKNPIAAAAAGHALAAQVIRHRGAIMPR